MIIKLRTGGGFCGTYENYFINTEKLPQPELEKLNTILSSCSFQENYFKRGGRDTHTYEFKFKFEDKKIVIDFDHLTVPPNFSELIKFILNYPYHLINNITQRT